MNPPEIVGISTYCLTGTYYFARKIGAHNSVNFKGFLSHNSDENLGHNSRNYEKFPVIPILLQKNFYKRIHNT